MSASSGIVLQQLSPYQRSPYLCCLQANQQEAMMRGASSGGHGAGVGAGAGAGAGTVARRDPLAGYRPRVVAGMWTLFMLVLKRSLVQVRGSCCHVCGTVCQCAFVHQVTVYTACVFACACVRIQSARHCHRLLQHSRTKMSFLIGESSI
jgi:hypothetical protein